MITSSLESNIILIADPKVLAIPVKETDEPFINLREQDVIAYGPSPEIPNNLCYTKLRKSVYERLASAQKLLPEGLQFCVYEGYRSLSLQTQLFEKRYNLVKSYHPNWSHEAIFMETTRLVSPVVNLDGSNNIPPHATGAAVDLYLTDKNGNAIDMGIHPKDWMQDKDGSLSKTESPVISEQAQHYRRYMSDALTAVEFVNYPTEFWHWSYGDRYWAYHKDEPYAFYNTVEE